MKKILLAASAAALTFTAVAVAQEPDVQRRGPGGMLFQSDTNQDGVLTRAEFDAGRTAMFTRMDADNDGSVTREERRAQFEARRGQRGEHGPRRHGRHNSLERLDVNNDGSITREEYLAHPIARFDRLDADKNGVISASERPQPRERGERPARMNPDANNDGALSRAEFDAQSSAMFTRLDANSDGQVTREEAAAARPHRGPRPAQ